MKRICSTKLQPAMGKRNFFLCNAAAAGGEAKRHFYSAAAGGGFNELVEQLKSSNN